MEKYDLPAFAKLLAGLGELYGKPVSEMLTELYWTALKRFELTAIYQAVNCHMSNPDTGQFMPKPADLVRYLEGNAKTKAWHAWRKIIDAMRQVGHYTSVVFDDPLIHSVIDDMGGWISLCKQAEKDLPFRAREFEKRYASYLIHPPLYYPRQLTGLLDSACPLATNMPLLIGDKERALHVYQQGQSTLLLTPYYALPPMGDQDKTLETT